MAFTRFITCALIVCPAVHALAVEQKEKPLCKTGADAAGWPVGAGGKWKVSEKLQKDLPVALNRGLNVQQGCSYDKLMKYEPSSCRLPDHVDDVPVKPKRVVFIGDSVMDNSAASFSWFYQKENRMAFPKACTFGKDQMVQNMQKAPHKYGEGVMSKALNFMARQGATNKKGKGHYWWGCRNSTVMYAPLLTLGDDEHMTDREEVIHAFMHNVKTFGEEPLGQDDVIVMNMGLHGIKDGEKRAFVNMDKQWTPDLAKIMKVYAEWKKKGTAPKLIWREVTPQHFPNPNGNWKADTKTNCAPIGNANKVALDPNTFPTRNNNMFSKAVKDAGLEIDGKDIAVLPTWRASADRFEEHPTDDCTHFCVFGSVNHYMNTALLATASTMLQATMSNATKAQLKALEFRRKMKLSHLKSDLKLNATKLKLKH